MAELILNGRGPHGGPGAVSYYDFEPGNEAMLEAIETFLAKRSRVPEMEEAYLAELCDLSTVGDSATIRKATPFGWMGILRSMLRNARDGARNIRKQTRRPPGGKPGRTATGNGYRRRLSVA